MSWGEWFRVAMTFSLGFVAGAGWVAIHLTRRRLEDD